MRPAACSLRGVQNDFLTSERAFAKRTIRDPQLRMSWTRFQGCLWHKSGEMRVMQVCVSLVRALLSVSKELLTSTVNPSLPDARIGKASSPFSKRETKTSGTQDRPKLILSAGRSPRHVRFIRTKMGAELRRYPSATLCLLSDFATQRGHNLAVS